MADRRIPASAVRRTALATLGRMACAYMDPADQGHNHAVECLMDPEAVVADMLLRIAFAASTGDDDATLDRLTDLTGIIALDQ